LPEDLVEMTKENFKTLYNAVHSYILFINKSILLNYIKTQ